jgi:DNA (cytosine-5)-methyltransferase 1
MENVSNLLSKKHILNFEKWCKKLETLGYNNYYQILSSSDYGIPQERKRVFMVSVLNEDSVFVFPKKRELTKCVLDFIEKDRAHKVNKTLLPYYNKKYHEKYTSKNGLIKIFDGEKQGFFKSDFTNKRIYSGHGTCPTITKNNKINIYELNGVVNGNEALLLMGFDKTDVNKLNFLSDNQKYSLAGNSIVVNVLEDLFKEIVKFKW